MFIYDFIYGQKNFSSLKFENWPFTEPNRPIGYTKNCSDILKRNVIVRRCCVVQKIGAGRAWVLLCSVAWPNSQKLVLFLAPVHRDIRLRTELLYVGQKIINPQTKWNRCNLQDQEALGTQD